MAEIIKLDVLTTHDIDTVDMLDEIAESKPVNAFVIVWPNDGTRPTYHSNTSDIAVVLMRLHEFIHKHFNGDFE